jgi:hypothetical protein
MKKQAGEPTPTNKYKSVTLAGWGVRVAPQCDAHRVETDDALKLLDEKLQEAERLIPLRQTKALKAGVTFWVEWERDTGAAVYHPSPVWLRQNRLNPDKARCVELSNVPHFVNWTRTDQPMMILHELAHALHHQVLGHDYKPIRQAFDTAKQAKIYEAVPYVHGGKRKAYALQNEQEYFAELSEAYFGRNDYFPYTRRDLQGHDAQGCRMVQEAWNK